MKSWPGTPVEPDPLPVNLAESVLQKHYEHFTVWSEQDAWFRYLALVAHSIAVDRLDLVPWSLADLTQASQLSVLFDARYFLIWLERCLNKSWESKDKTLYQRYKIDGYAVGFHKFSFKPFNDPGSGYPTIPADPRYLWSVLQKFVEWGKQDANQWATISHVLGYLRGGLPEPSGSAGPPFVRGLGEVIGDPVEVWDYRGGAPLQITLKGKFIDTSVWKGFAHVVHGNQGVVDVLRYALHNLNVPVEDATPNGYSMAVARFMTVGLYMTNGDDFHAPLNPEWPFVPPEQSMALLVGEDRFAELHPPSNTITPDQMSGNEHRPYFDAIINVLPVQLVRHYCCDKKDADGRVMYDLNSMNGGYGPVELAKTYPDFWARLEKRSAELGCNYLIALGGCKPMP
ncbi:MAG: hypothetical protein ACOYOB_16405 [Myxococcota bacterium]